jgi:hypothetical protein
VNRYVVDSKPSCPTAITALASVVVLGFKPSAEAMDAKSVPSISYFPLGVVYLLLSGGFDVVSENPARGDGLGQPLDIERSMLRHAVGVGGQNVLTDQRSERSPSFAAGHVNLRVLGMPPSMRRPGQVRGE